MERADLETLKDTLRDALLKSGREVRERKTVAGRAFLVDGRAVGQFEERNGSLRVRLWLADEERAAFEARPTFHRESGWLLVVSDDDVTFVCGLATAAFRAASAGKGSPPSASTVEIADMDGEEKKGGSRRALPNSRRPAGRG